MMVITDRKVGIRVVDGEKERVMWGTVKCGIKVLFTACNAMSIVQ